MMLACICMHLLPLFGYFGRHACSVGQDMLMLGVLIIDYVGYTAPSRLHNGTQFR